MNKVYKTQQSLTKTSEINNFLSGYWSNDIWHNTDSFFDQFYSDKRNFEKRTINFSSIPENLKDELKFMFAYKLSNNIIRPRTSWLYSSPIIALGMFLQKYYSQIESIIELPYDKAILQWNSYLTDTDAYNTNNNLKQNQYRYGAILRQFYSFISDYYDERAEFDKNIWDLRKIPGTKIADNSSLFKINFEAIPNEFISLVKRYLKYRILMVSISQCKNDVMGLKLFFNYIHDRRPEWTNINDLRRSHIEEYMHWLKSYLNGRDKVQRESLMNLYTFLNYIQRAQYSEAPVLVANCLFLDGDIPKRLRVPEKIKYISEDVLLQLENNLEHLTPTEYIPIIILLRASGWRISDILNLRYDTCLDKTSQGWYLCGDILKTQVLNHRIPITDEIANLIKIIAKETKNKSTLNNNPKKLLFVRYSGKRIGKCPPSYLVSSALNRLVESRNIVDDEGKIFHFKNHAFRHTKAVELINNGMSLLHVQKWLAHSSPEMCLQYAKILDTTMRKSWEEVTKQGLFRIDEEGSLKKIDISDIENEDIIEWEYIRHNLDAVRMPLGYCMKPKKQECHTQLNPCLTCRNLCTSPDFIPQFELEIQETKTVIERGKAQNRNVWVEKNQALLERYIDILSVLKTGKIHHKAGKKGREYTKEELSNGQ